MVVGTVPVGAGSMAVGGTVAVQGSPEEGAGLRSPGEVGLQAGHKDCRVGSSSLVAAAAAVAGGNIEGPRKGEAGCSRSGVGVEQEAAELEVAELAGLKNQGCDDYRWCA